MQSPQQHLVAAPGVPGFNKQLRDRAKYALALTTLLLFSKSHSLACLSSAYSIYVLKAGTAISSKNFKWMLLSIISFCVGLSCAILDGRAQFVDGQRDYSFQARLQFWSFALRTFWWPTLALFVVCTWGYVPHSAPPSRKDL
jgi:hypothetical protein